MTLKSQSYVEKFNFSWWAGVENLVLPRDLYFNTQNSSNMDVFKENVSFELQLLLCKSN